MRRSPRPSTGRAAHPDRAVLAASFAEDVVLDLQCSDEVIPQQQRVAVAGEKQTGGASVAMSGRGPTTHVVTGTTTSTKSDGSPRAAPRFHSPPVPKPRSGMGFIRRWHPLKGNYSD